MEAVNGFKNAKIPLFEYVPASWGFVKFACCADMHNNLQNISVPEADGFLIAFFLLILLSVLLIAGDFTLACSDEELRVFDEAVGKLPHAYKVWKSFFACLLRFADCRSWISRDRSHCKSEKESKKLHHFRGGSNYSPRGNLSLSLAYSDQTASSRSPSMAVAQSQRSPKICSVTSF